MATCNICHAEYPQGTNPCWRCGESNRYWEQQRRLSATERATAFFGNLWGGMAFVVNIFPFAFVVGILTQSIAAWFYPGLSLGFQRTGLLGQSLAWFLSFICILFIYALRFELWHYSWIRNIRRQRTPSLNMAAGVLFIVGVLLILAYLTAQIYWQPGTAGGESRFTVFLSKIIMPGIYASIFVALCLASALMAAVLFIARLSEHVGQPIYMNTNLLSKVVQDDTARRMANIVKEGPDPLSADDEKKLAEIKKRLRVSSLKRTPFGGILVRLNYLKEGDSSAASSVTDASVERRFDVEANEWGQITVLTDLGAPPKAEGKDGQEQAQNAGPSGAKGKPSIESKAAVQEEPPLPAKEKPPLMSTERLVEAVQRSITETLKLAPPVTLEVVSIERPTQGGLRATFNRLKEGEFDGVRYEVEADEWGHISCLEQRLVPKDKPSPPMSDSDLPDYLNDEGL